MKTVDDTTKSNYVFIPQISQGNSPPRHVLGTEQFEGTIRLKVRTISPMFIGTGREGRQGDRLYRRSARTDETLCIPGSSLKGTVKTIAQCVSECCIDHSRAVTEIGKGTHPRENGCQCIVCSLFGVMGNRSRVYFEDLPMTSGESDILGVPVPFSVPDLFKSQPRYFHPEGSDLVPNGIKIYPSGDWRPITGDLLTECAMPGSTFEGDIMFTGLDIDQLRLLCYALAIDGSYRLRIGGNKSNYFGEVETDCIGFSTHSIQPDQNIRHRIRTTSEVQPKLDPVKLAEEHGQGNDRIAMNKRLLAGYLEGKG
jgi:CRISPR-associated protein Csm3